MLYRFVIAYAVLWIFYPRLPKVKKWKDEAIFLQPDFSEGRSIS